MVSNLVAGVTKGFERRLEITGVGYRAAVQGKNLQLSLGYSHEVLYPIPDGIAIATPRPIEIVVNRSDPCSALLRIVDLVEMTPAAISAWSDTGGPGLDKRFHLVPAARLLITIPHTNDKLVLRRLDIEKAIRGSRGAG